MRQSASYLLEGAAVTAGRKCVSRYLVARVSEPCCQPNPCLCPQPSLARGAPQTPTPRLPGTSQQDAAGGDCRNYVATANASSMAVSQASQVAGDAPLGRRVDSDDDSPIKPKPAMKSKLLSDSEDEVPVKPLRLAPQLATPDASQGKCSNGKSSAPVRQRAKSAVLGGSAARGVHSSEGEVSRSLFFITVSTQVLFVLV